MLLQRKYFFLLITCLITIISILIFYNFDSIYSRKNSYSIFGPKVQLKSSWIGNIPINYQVPILVLAGHADSQNSIGRGTLGEAVSLNGALPMDPYISDELFWNLKVQKEVVKIGKKRGLIITSYDPLIRNIDDPDDPITNWSVGSRHALQGGYAIELHFDAYGRHGIGSGLIPPISKNLNTLDEAIASSFGRFPLFFRGGLGAPRRQIRVLEIGKLEGELERNLRNVQTRDRTIQFIANQIVNSMIRGLQK